MRGSWLLCIVLAASIGCVGELVEDDPTPGGTADAGQVNMAARMFFDQNVQPMFGIARPKLACTVCHEGAEPANGPDFLGATPAVNYATLKADTRLVGTTAAASVLITRGDHSGDAFCTGVNVPYAGCTVDEVGLITQWINLEAGN